ncbi:MAG TPA: hypothetical protein VKB69_01640 [Micromonosporaceae bacterium]|nr:hypothetical protein [Micromonosporaceae bacterium]
MSASRPGSAPRPAPASSEPTAARGVDITAAPRVVITFASELVARVFGERPSARENAWQAVCADRKRAAERAELASVLREVGHGRPAVRAATNGAARPATNGAARPGASIRPAGRGPATSSRAADARREADERLDADARRGA